MFSDRSFSYQNNHSNASFESCPSLDSSFTTDGSLLMTPPATTPRRQSSLTNLKIEDTGFATPTSCHTPIRSNNTPNYDPLSVMTQNMLILQNQQPFFSNLTSYFDEHTSLIPNAAPVPEGMYSHHVLTIQPTPFDGFASLSDTSPMSEDFIDPTQTTFMQNFDMTSPIHARSLEFDIQYDEDASEYGNCISMDGSPTASIKSEAHSCVASTSSTPIRLSPARQPLSRPLQTSAALHRVQSLAPTESTATSRQDRKQRQRREQNEYTISNHVRIRYEQQSQNVCHMCEKKFKRTEHLKRHLRTHTDEEKYPCPFCTKKKQVFNRRDNLKAHLKLHWDPKDPNKAKKRTDYCQEAYYVWAAMVKKPRKAGAEGRDDE